MYHNAVYFKQIGKNGNKKVDSENKKSFEGKDEKERITKVSPLYKYRFFNSMFSQ
jgi:hypothetical protein